MAATASYFPIASLDAGHTLGRIGMCFCPGRPPYSPLGSNHKRDLAKDLGTIARWGASLVVTLMEERELFELGLNDLPAQLRSLGITWLLIPLPESGMPGPSFESHWTTASSQLASVLEQRGRIVIHCTDGLQRTGLIAARLLVHLGCRPEDAINRVRAAKPGAISSTEQELEIFSARLPASNAASTRSVVKRRDQPVHIRAFAKQILRRPVTLPVLAPRASPASRALPSVSMLREDNEDPGHPRSSSEPFDN
jgi:ADP-ribosyl-[dinitrogen reductase] hydrolase